MSRKVSQIRWLICAVFLLTVADVVSTAIGIRLGVIAEANPLLRNAMHRYPIATGVAACVYTGALLALIYRFGHRCKSTVPLLMVLLAVKTAVMGLHLGWILAL